MKAHIAAVMGPQLYRQLRFDDYRAADWIAKDSRLVLEISRASRAAPRLQAAVENNLEQIMKWCREAVMAELTHLDPSFDPNTPRSESLIDKANDEHERLTKEIERKLKVMDLTAFAVCMENDLPIIVFDIGISGNIKRAVEGEPIGTLVGRIKQ